MEGHVIIPLCIYHETQNSLKSAIEYPYLEIEKKELVCPKHFPHNWRYYQSFYAVNPMIGLRIPGMRKICLIGESKTSSHFDPIIDVNIEMEIFSKNDECISFYAYTQPTQYTTPLYFYLDKGYVYMSFDQLNLPKHDISLIYVIDEKYFTRMDGKIEFKFSRVYTRCLPDPNGGTLEKCISEVTNQMLNPGKRYTSLLDYLMGEKCPPYVKYLILICVTVLFIFFIMIIIKMN